MLNDSDFKCLLQFLDRPWAGYRKVRKGVKKRIRRHMTELGCATMDTYLHLLAARSDLRTHCEQCLQVTISRFFRDRHLWRHLQTTLLPDLIARFAAPIRIWSAGCASGEEPYSLAIAWKGLPHPPSLALLATDANNVCLARAREGIYSRSSLKEAGQQVRDQYFKARRSGRQYAIQHHLLPTIAWQQHQLLGPPLPGPFQMILLRNNLLTYYQGDTLKTALQQIIQTLSSTGYLVVGAHEHLPTTQIKFKRNTACPWVYQKLKS